MNEIISTLTFMVFPLIVALFFSLFLPVVGATLYIRNETMTALALPPAAGALLTLLVAIGISVEMEIVLVLLSSITVAFLFYAVLQYKCSSVKRQLILASLFVGGNGLTRLLMTISPKAEGGLSHLLSGELLAIGKNEMIITGIFMVLIVTLFFKWRGTYFAFILDQEILRLKPRTYSKTVWSYRILSAFSVTLGVILIGPLLTTAFLIFPPLLADIKKGSVSFYFKNSTIIGFLGVFSGFIIAATIDIPPAYSVTLFLPIVGIIVNLIMKYLISMSKTF